MNFEKVDTLGLLILYSKFVIFVAGTLNSPAIDHSLKRDL